MKKRKAAKAAKPTDEQHLYRLKTAQVVFLEAQQAAAAAGLRVEITGSDVRVYREIRNLKP